MGLRHCIIVFLAATAAITMSPVRMAVAVGPVVNAEPATDDTCVYFGGDCSTAPTLAPTSYANSGVPWLGGEFSLLGIVEEAAGVENVLSLLTEEERNQIIQSDTTLPIRYFRGAKVSEVHWIGILSCCFFTGEYRR